MSIDSRRPVGTKQGLNLNVDPTQTSGLLVADGIRYDEIGAIVGRFGRKRFSMSWPKEFFGNVPAETITHLIAPSGGARGFRQFYDTRLVTRAPEVLFNNTLDEREGLTAIGWAKTGDVIDIDQGAILHRHNTGTGTAQQVAADFSVQNPTVSIQYELKYSIEPRTAGTFLSSLTLGTGFAAAPVALSATRGTHTTQFTANATITDFTLTSVSGSAGDFYISGLSLKPVVAFGADRLPTRLNILHKGLDQKLYFNESVEGGVDGILSGVSGFEDADARAKFVQYADDIYIIEETTVPMLFTRKADKEQRYAQRVKYEVIPASVPWPKPSSARPSVTNIAGLVDPLPAGIYSFRVQFETVHGRKTGPSMPGSYNLTQSDVTNGLYVTWGGMLGDPDLVGLSHANVYVQITDPNAAIEPTDYKLVKRISLEAAGDDGSDATDSLRFTMTDYRKKSIGAALNLASGHMPRLLDFKIVNDVGYGIPANDTVYREETKDSPPVQVKDIRGGRLDDGQDKLWDTTEIKEVRLSPAWLMVSEPGEPYIMQRRFPIEHAEQGVGLSTMGDTVFVHTSDGLHAFSDDPPIFKRIPSSVGTLTRDSIQEDERMIRFMGDDAVPRLFNGAVIEEIALELLPLFDQEDYAGYYFPFDRSRVTAVSSASGKRRYFLSFPTAPGGGDVSHKPGLSDESNVLAIADMSKGRSQWSLDRTPYDELSWLGRESRILGVTSIGEFYALEEGLEDQNAATLPVSVPATTAAERRFGREGFTTRFFKLAFEAHTQGQNMTLTCQLDEDPELTETYTVNTSGRERVEFYLPGWFKGLYLDVTFSGTTTTSGRQRVYDVKVEQEVMGVL